MSKKKRKTRAEKTTPLKHDFVAPVYKLEEKDNSEQKEGPKGKKASPIDPRVLFDLKKVGIIISLMIVLVGLVAYLVYKTNIFHPLFSKLGITY
jgi:hypothetical protein